MKLIRVILFSLLALAILDVSVSLLITKFKYSDDHGRLKQYFDYGVSTKQKLKYLLGDSDEDAKPITFAGWNELLPERNSNVNSECVINMTVYGMSFSNRIASELEQIDECYSIRRIAGPGAPLSHSYYMYEKHGNADDSDIVMLAVLASSLVKLRTMAHLSSSFEYPGSHLYPRYQLSEYDELLAIAQKIESRDDLRNTLRDPIKAEQFLQVFEDNDEYFSKFVFSYEWADYSNTLKMLRRAYAQRHIRTQTLKYFSNGTFLNTNRFTDVAKKLVVSFIDDVKESGKTPVILLLNDRGFAETLDPLFIDLLESENVIYLTTTGIIDSNNMSNFIGDGHFTKANDRLLAERINSTLKQSL